MSALKGPLETLLGAATEPASPAELAAATSVGSGTRDLEPVLRSDPRVLHGGVVLAARSNPAGQGSEPTGQPLYDARIVRSSGGHGDSFQLRVVCEDPPPTQT